LRHTFEVETIIDASVDAPVDPEERGAMTDGTRLGEREVASCFSRQLPMQMLLQELVPPGGIDDPLGVEFDPLIEVGEGDSVVSLTLTDIDLQAIGGLEELDRIGRDQSLTNGVLEAVAVDLEATDVREGAEVDLRELVEVVAGGSLRRPVEAEVVLEVVLVEEIALQIEDPSEVVAGELNRRFTDLGAGRGRVSPFDESDALVGI
jgi:hypothetical protein